MGVSRIVYHYIAIYACYLYQLPSKALRNSIITNHRLAFITGRYPMCVSVSVDEIEQVKTHFEYLAEG